jgi:DNA-binding SARP family transcriptional activator
MTRLEVRVLGGFEARLSGGPDIVLPTRKTQALLAFLALPPGPTHPRDKLAALLWGDMGQAEARRNLRRALFALRQAAGDAGALVTEGGSVALDPARVSVDAVEVERLLRDGSLAALEAAARLYRGDLLAGLALAEAPFEEWLLAERERLRELALEAMARLLALQQDAGAVEAAIATALKLSALDPLQEPVHRALMRLYARAGRRGAALKQYQLCVSALERELRTEPEPETRALYQELLRERRTVRGRERPVPEPAAPAMAEQTAIPLIGRRGELARLEAVLDSAWQGRGQLMAITGAPGVGKSRLAAEAAAVVLRRGGRVLAGHCYESEKILPLAPWVEALRSAGVAEDAALVDGLAPAWRSALAALLPEMAGAGTPAAGDAARTFEAIASVVARLGRTRPLLIVVEDIQWADELSTRLILYLARRIAAWPVVLVVTARSDDLRRDPLLRQAREELRRGGHAPELQIGALSREDTSRLTRTLLGLGGHRHAGPDLDERVWRATEGNPFVVVETVRVLQDHEGPAGAALPLPAGVRALVLDRLDRLPATHRRLVEIGAVIGRQFDFDLLVRASGLGEEEAAAGVEDLVRREIFGQAGEGFEFTHDRIREVAREAVLPRRRAVLHRQVAEALEAREGDRAEAALAIGAHYREGEVWPRAAQFLERAGRAASARGAAADAAMSYEQALEALARVPDDTGSRRHAFQVHLFAAYERYQLGEPARALDHLRQGEVLARALGDERSLVHLASGLTYTLAMGGRYREALDSGERALHGARALGEPGLEAFAWTGLGIARHALGEYRRSIECARAALAALPEAPARPGSAFVGIPPEITARAWLTISCARLGDFREAVRWGEETVALAEARGSLRARVSAYHGLAVARGARGDFDEAARLFEEALRLCEDGPLAWYASRSQATLAFVHALRGDLARALPLLERAVAEAEVSGVVLDHTRALTYVADTLLWAGRRDEARRMADRALALARERGERGDEAWSLEVLGEVSTGGQEPDAGDIEAGIGHFEAALKLAEQLEMRSLQARCHLGLGQAHARAGRRAEARASLARAVQLFEALEMRSWLARAHAALAALG